MNPKMQPCLDPTPTVDSDNVKVKSFVEKHIGKTDNKKEQAISLYYAVRDEIRYDPYSIELSVDGLKASQTLNTGRGWCVAKAILLAACCRSMEIPARLGYADIRNHLSTDRMRQQMKTDIFFWHGYTSIYLDGAWVKATPAFNIELCEKFAIMPLAFDGRTDSIYHPFDLAGNKHMEYLNYRGEFADVPIDEIKETFVKEYLKDIKWEKGDFDREVERETSHR